MLPSNTETEEIDELLELMASSESDVAGKPQWAKVIRTHYTMRGKTKVERLSSTGVSTCTYARYLNQGHSWIAL